MRLQLPNDQESNRRWNASVNVGFNANRSATNTRPTAFLLNGTPGSIL